MTQKSTSIPQINPTYWGFMLGGQVRIPLMLSYADLLAQPATDVVWALGCASSHSHIRESQWRGVLLTTLLDQLEPQPEAHHAHIFAADGYKTSITLERLRGAVLVYERDGQPLSPEAGFPIRLIVPGLYGYKMPKWLQRIELRATPLLGTWEQRGWSMDGVAHTRAVIATPRHRAHIQGQVTLAGTAFAGEHTISQIEINVDDSAWMPVDFTPQPTHRLVNWSIEWTPPTPGDFRVQVRATDNTGFTQFDDLHSIVVGVQS